MHRCFLREPEGRAPLSNHCAERKQLGQLRVARGGRRHVPDRHYLTLIAPRTIIHYLGSTNSHKQGYVACGCLSTDDFSPARVSLVARHSPEASRQQSPLTGGAVL